MENTKDMVQALLGQGFTQIKIAEESGVNQPTVSRALNGRGVSYDNGKKIELLYMRVCMKSKKSRRKTDATASP